MTWITWYKLKGFDGGATKADGGASAPVGPSVATPLTLSTCIKATGHSKDTLTGKKIDQFAFLFDYN